MSQAAQSTGSQGGISGVEFYKGLDPAKVRGQRMAEQTDRNLSGVLGGRYSSFAPSRGESVHLVEGPSGFLAHLVEGLGTKNLAADGYRRECAGGKWEARSRRLYEWIGISAVATMVNDIVTLGAQPLSCAMHLAVGDDEWIADEERLEALYNGWRVGCDLAGCAWGGGETPKLRDIIVPGTAAISGSAMGIIEPKGRLIKGDIKAGDTIIFFHSSGVHDNGLSTCRDIAASLPDGYLTTLPNGQHFGEALLIPTRIYVQLIQKLLDHGIDIHYGVHISGHGWRKLTRAVLPLSYEIDTLPPSLPIFEFIRKHARKPVKELYEIFNMGVGFAIFVPEDHADRAVRIAEASGFAGEAFRGGTVKAGKRQVVIKPLDLVLPGESLAVR